MPGLAVVDAPDDPARCQGIARFGQCPNRVSPGQRFCPEHGGRDTTDADAVREYLISQADVRDRLANLQAQRDPIRDLQRAINLTHLLIERRLDGCRSQADWLAACGPLMELTKRMESLVKSLIQVEQKLDELLPRTAVLELGQHIQQIIVEELRGIPNYEEVVDRIADRLFGAAQRPTIEAIDAIPDSTLEE